MSAPQRPGRRVLEQVEENRTGIDIPVEYYRRNARTHAREASSIMNVWFAMRRHSCPLFGAPLRKCSSWTICNHTTAGAPSGTLQRRTDDSHRRGSAAILCRGNLGIPLLQTIAIDIAGLRGRVGKGHIDARPTELRNHASGRVVHSSHGTCGDRRSGGCVVLRSDAGQRHRRSKWSLLRRDRCRQNRRDGTGSTKESLSFIHMSLGSH